MPNDEIANLFARKFIARTDVKAIQQSDGAWHPHTKTGKRDGIRIPWRRDDLREHLDGTRTFGHYLLDQRSRCKLFAFDVDLRQSGRLPSLPLSSEHDDKEWRESFCDEPDLRGAWLNRAHPARDYIKLQFKQMAHKLLSAIHTELELPCAAAYSGGKGIHVYGFTGLIDAGEVREAAQIVIDSIGEFKPFRGENFLAHRDFLNLSVEIFPKQNSLDGKDLGNLMRLPLGKNRKSPQEPTFFIDMIGPFGQMKPINPLTALTQETPWG